jgi:hypothetical protein
MNTDEFDLEIVRRYAKNNPHATLMDALAQLSISPAYRKHVAAIINDEELPVETPTTSEDDNHDQDEELTTTEIREHYRRARPVYEALGDVCGNETLAIADHVGWYTKRDTHDLEIADEWPKQGRCLTFGRGFEEFVGRIERVAYATTSYNDPEYLDQWHACRYDPDRETTEWRGERDSATPPATATAAIAAWGDVDLRDELKPKRGVLDADTRETIETTLEAYIDEFADLYGDRDAVYALDSVGGAYIFGAPEATLPLGQIFADDTDAAGRVLCEFIGRSNEWLEAAEERVNERIDGAADVIAPDWVNNPNRQYKAPLSVHKDHDAIVTPIDTDNVAYRLTRFDEVDDGLRDEAQQWAERLTADEHVSCIKSLVATLWPDEYEAADSWAEALRSWVGTEREYERRRKEKRAQEGRQRRERLEDLDGAVTTTGQTVTPSKGDIGDAVEAIDVGEVVRKYASDRWDTETRGQKTMFDPSWRDSNSGTSCYVNHSNNTFYDTGNEAGGGPARAMALGKRIISHPGDRLSGERWGMTLDALRSAGYNVPLWVPERGSKHSDGRTYDQTPLWALRKAALALNILPADGFVTRESDGGGTYEGFPGRVTFDRTLDELEALGIDHGRDRDGSANNLPSRVEAGLEKEPENKDEKIVQIFKEMGRQQRQSGQ